MAAQGQGGGYYNAPNNFGYSNISNNNGPNNNYYQPQQNQYQPPPPPNYGQQPPEQYAMPQYQQQQGPPPPQQQQAPYNSNTETGYSNGYGAGGEKTSFDQAFKIEKPKWNDLWAGILFLLFVAGFVVVSALSLQGYSSNRGSTGNGIYGGNNTVGLNTNTIILFAFVLVVAAVLSYLYVWIARLFPKQFIWVTGILNIVFGLVTAIYMLYRKNYAGGFVFLIFVVFLAFCFYTWIPRIPFSALMLKTSITVAKNYGHVYLVSALGGLVAVALAGWFSITFVSVYTKYQPGQAACRANGAACSDAKVIGLLVFITFTMYWISEWLKNTIHVAISGVYGAWYFHPQNPPKGATRGALKRALTYSFGSISLGSLLVAIVNFLRQVCSIAQRNEAAEGDIISSILFFCLGCILSILQWAVEFLNRYAFSYIALYGKSYFAAAKDTWKMIKDRGIDALVNECLIGPVLTFGATFVAYACALFAYLYLLFTNPGYNSNGSYTSVIVAFAFLIGLQICHVFTTPISFGIDTIFVAAAWDPQVLYAQHPELYQAMVQVYPQVAQAIHA